MALGPQDLLRLAQMLGLNECPPRNDDEAACTALEHDTAHANDVVIKQESAVSLSKLTSVTQRPNHMDDDRLKPEVTFVYCQDVRSEDIFLRLSLRTPGTASCENLSVRIAMPEENADPSEIDAQVNSNCLDVSSPRYCLHLPLPHPVDTGSEPRAQWDATRRILMVTMRLSRELDYTNF